MTDAIRSAGYYELPVPIVVSDDVLGTVCWTKIGTIAAQIYTPLLARDDVDRPALPPRLPGIPTDNPRIASPWDWVMTFDANAEHGATCLRRVGVVLEEQAEQQARLPTAGGTRATRLGIAALDGMSEWVERLRTWVEVLTRQDLDHHHPRYDVSYIGAGLWMSNELVPDIQLGQREPIDLHRWKSALERIGKRQEPPLEHLVGCDARAAFRRGDLRRAAIDAGTATEMVLGKLYRQTVSVGAGAAPGQDHWNLDRRNLTLLVNALLEVDVHLAVSTEALESLISARVAATDEGRETSADRLLAILATMTTVLAAHGPDPL